MYKVSCALHACCCNMAHAFLIALERQDLSCMYLAHHELENNIIIVIMITVVVSTCLGV